MKQDGTCAVADFGFAMKVPHKTKPVDDGTLITEVHNSLLVIKFWHKCIKGKVDIH